MGLIQFTLVMEGEEIIRFFFHSLVSCFAFIRQRAEVYHDVWLCNTPLSSLSETRSVK